MSSFLGWVGSKQRCSEEIISEFPVKFKCYHEPFLGSGSIFFNLFSKFRIFEKAYLSDLNKNLINAFIAVRDEPERVAKVLLHCCEKNSQEFYNNARNNMNSPAVFIYVIRACFSNLYRENQKGQFNVPWRSSDFVDRGRKISVDVSEIETCSRYLNRWAPYNDSIVSGRWQRVLDIAEKDDVVYFDPPYCPYNDNGFVNYVSDGFNESEYIYLRNMCEQLSKKGCHVFLSNSDTPATRRLFGEPTKLITLSNSTKSTATSKGKRSEAFYKF